MRYDVLGGGPADLVVLADDDGAVVAAGFRAPDRIAQQAGIGDELQPAELTGVREAWRRYLDGDMGALDRVVVEQQGSPLQEQVWAQLRRIPAAAPLTYGEVAQRIGRPRAARAVGSACGANRVAPFVPCHRVVAADGGLGGYGYGLAVKQWLLQHEAASVG